MLLLLWLLLLCVCVRLCSCLIWDRHDHRSEQTRQGAARQDTTRHETRRRETTRHARGSFSVSFLIGSFCFWFLLGLEGRPTASAWAQETGDCRADGKLRHHRYQHQHQQQHHRHLHETRTGSGVRRRPESSVFGESGDRDSRQAVLRPRINLLSFVFLSYVFCLYLLSLSFVFVFCLRQ